MGYLDFLFGKKKAPSAPEAPIGVPGHMDEIIGNRNEDDDIVLQPGMNTGVIDVDPDPSDWIAGGETGIDPTILLEDGQYDDYLPDEEPQSFYFPSKFDTQSCVTFSATNNIETLITLLWAQGKLSKRQTDFLRTEGYINPQTGKVNFSDRFTARVSGTTQDGNSLARVGDSIRRDHGLVPESDWPMPDWNTLKGKSQDEIWQIYMAPIPPEVYAKGRRFLEVFKINYQWVILVGEQTTPAIIREILKQGPFQISSKVCSGWSSNNSMPPIRGCGCGSGHATLVYGYKDYKGTQATKLFDHYKSFRKLLAEDYCIYRGIQYAVSENTTPAIVPINYTFTKQLRYGMPASDEVNRLQKALQDLGHMTRGVFGPYGPQTRAALGAFQTKHGISDPDGPGTNFGPQTRAAMNAAIKNLNQ
jgi:hypothetical protein